MELDLSKPVRVKRGDAYCHEGKTFYPTTKPNPYGRVYGLVEGTNIEQDMPLHWLENIPEPVKETVYIFKGTGQNSVYISSHSDNFGGKGLPAKITVWRDEDGETHVEVAE